MGRDEASFPTPRLGFVVRSFVSQPVIRFFVRHPFITIFGGAVITIFEAPWMIVGDSGALTGSAFTG